MLCCDITRSGIFISILWSIIRISYQFLFCEIFVMIFMLETDNNKSFAEPKIAMPESRPFAVENPLWQIFFPIFYSIFFFFLYFCSVLFLSDG